MYTLYNDLQHYYYYYSVYKLDYRERTAPKMLTFPARPDKREGLKKSLVMHRFCLLQASSVSAKVCLHSIYSVLQSDRNSLKIYTF